MRCDLNGRGLRLKKKSLSLSLPLVRSVSQSVSGRVMSLIIMATHQSFHFNLHSLSPTDDGEFELLIFIYRNIRLRLITVQNGCELIYET